MADSDSFINEVSEEVRRDKLFALFRRWAWLAALVVVIVVGGAAFFEYQRAQTESASQAFGDAVIAALDGTEAADRIAALEAIDAPGPEGEILLALLAAGEAASDDDRAAAATRLRAVAETPELAVRYRHLALLKAHLLAPADPAEARLVLGVLAEPGAPYAALAEEQLALLDIAGGDVEAGLDRLRRLEIAAEATPGLQQRAGQLIVALESGSALVETSSDTAPETAREADMPSDDGGLGNGGDLLPPGTDAGETGAEAADEGADGAANEAGASGDTDAGADEEAAPGTSDTGSETDGDASDDP